MTRIQLDRCRGPECPNCGCRDAELLREPIPDTPQQKTWFGSGLAECNHCRRRFHFKELPAQPQPPPIEDVSVELEEPAPLPDPPRIEKTFMPVVMCDDCNVQMRITSTKKALRYHRCPQCGNTAKTAR